MLRIKVNRISPSEEGEFQWAPTLGGECYMVHAWTLMGMTVVFQWAPTLGGECYRTSRAAVGRTNAKVSMGTHPWG